MVCIWELVRMARPASYHIPDLLDYEGFQRALRWPSNIERGPFYLTQNLEVPWCHRHPIVNVKP